MKTTKTLPNIIPSIFLSLFLFIGLLYPQPAKVAVFSEEDPRSFLTEEEWLRTYRGVGVISISYDDGNIGTALAIECPDKVKDIVITNAHAVEEAKVKDLEYEDYNQKDNRYNRKIGIAKLWMSNARNKGDVFEDWAVLKLKTPLPRSVQTFKVFDGSSGIEQPRRGYSVSSPSSIQYTGCVDFVAQTYLYIKSDKKYSMWRHKERCEITELDDGTKPGLTYSAKCPTYFKHNCYALRSNSGGALFGCDNKQLVGIHRGTTSDKLKIKVQPYTTTRRPGQGYHFSKGMLIDKDFLSAIKIGCRD